MRREGGEGFGHGCSPRHADTRIFMCAIQLFQVFSHIYSVYALFGRSVMGRY